METAFYAGSVPHCHIRNLQKIITAWNREGGERSVFVHTTDRWRESERLGEREAERKRERERETLRQKM